VRERKRVREFIYLFQDGRVVFVLPWLGKTLVGTTDSVTELTTLPRAHENEIQFILDEISHYLSLKGSLCLFVPTISTSSCFLVFFLLFENDCIKQ
jgi:hypothetical protein